MSLTSGERKVRGFRTDSETKTQTDSTRFRSRESGMGWDGMSGEDLQPFVERCAREFAWVRQHLPSENEGMAVSALLSIKTFGDKPTKNAVMDRLRAQGRTAEQMREKGWIK